jgi:MoaA/NifB/PqqE/SkfB family radical SAM enzyme
MVDLALKLKVDLLNFSHTAFLSPELAERHNRALSPEFAGSRGMELIPPSIPQGEYYQSEVAAADIPVLARNLGEVKRRARGRIQVGFSPNLPASLLRPYYLDLDHPFPQDCHNPWTTARVMPDGKISPCLHLVMGEITTAPLREIWNNSRYQTFRRLLQARLFPGCARCCDRRYA